MKIKELKEKRTALLDQLTELRSQTQEKISDEQKREWDNLMRQITELDAKISREQQFLELQKDELRDMLPGGEKREEVADLLRRGILNRLTEEERATFDGVKGVALPKLVNTEVEVALKSFGGLYNSVRQLVTTTGVEISWPTLNDTANEATIVADYVEVEEDDMTFGMVNIKAFTFATKAIPIARALLEDSTFDIIAYVSNAIAEQIFRGVSTAIVTSDKNNAAGPEGIVKAALEAPIAASDAITADDLLDLQAKVDPAYAANGIYVLNHKTLIAIMKLKDSNGNYIWQANIGQGAGPTIFGRPYVIEAKMDDIGASKFPILFGDVKKYLLRIVRGAEYMTLKEKYAKARAIGLLGYMRADGRLIDAGTHPVAALKMGA